MNDKKIIFFLLSLISFMLFAGTFFTYAGVGNDATFTISQCATSGTILKAESRYMGVSTNSGPQPKHDACDSNDILVCTGYQTGIILSACNVGASVAGTGKVSNGMYFQYGRNKGFYYQSGATFEDILISSEIGKHAEKDSYGFINNFYYDGVTDWLSWYNGKINENWGYKDGTDIEKKGPCADGYHLPTIEEFSIVLHGNNKILDFFPKSGLITGQVGSQTRELNYVNNQVGSYWISTQEKKFGPQLSQFALNIRPNNEIEMVNYNPGNGLSVRCFKNLGEEKISYTSKKIKVPFSEFKNAFQEYFEVDKNNYFQKFGKTFKLVPVSEEPILLEDNIWMSQDYKEKLKNEVIYKKGGKYFYSNNGYYFVRIK